MAITEGQRMALAQDLAASIGEESAAALMSSILPEGKDHLATKADIRATSADVKALEAKTDAGFAAVNAKFVAVDARFTEVHARIDGLEAKTDAGFTKVCGAMAEMKGELTLLIAKQTRTMIFAVVGFAVPTWAAMAGILYAVV